MTRIAARFSRGPGTSATGHPSFSGRALLPRPPVPLAWREVETDVRLDAVAAGTEIRVDRHLHEGPHLPRPGVRRPAQGMRQEPVHLEAPRRTVLEQVGPAEPDLEIAVEELAARERQPQTDVMDVGHVAAAAGDGQESRLGLQVRVRRVARARLDRQKLPAQPEEALQAGGVPEHVHELAGRADLPLERLAGGDVGRPRAVDVGAARAVHRLAVDPELTGARRLPEQPVGEIDAGDAALLRIAGDVLVQVPAQGARGEGAAGGPKLDGRLEVAGPGGPGAGARLAEQQGGDDRARRAGRLQGFSSARDRFRSGERRRGSDGADGRAGPAAVAPTL